MRLIDRTVSATKGWVNLQRGKRRALLALKQVEATRGKTPTRLVRRCREYAREALGWVGYAPWLCVYAAIRNEFFEGWMPSNYYATEVVPAIKGRHGRLSDFKTLSGQFFSDALPDVGYSLNGLLLDRHYHPIDRGILQESAFGHRGRVVFKLDHSNKGAGVSILDRSAFAALNLDQADGVFQSYIEQSPFLEAISPGSVATLRLTTVRELDGSIGLRAAYLRAGRTHEDIVKSASNIRVAVDIRTGSLSSQAYLPNWSEIHAHPDTGFVFSGEVIPEFSLCSDLVMGLHTRVPHIGCIGWDLALDHRHRPWLMEWNGWVNDIKFSEAVDGPCFLGLGWERFAKT